MKIVLRSNLLGGEVGMMRLLIFVRLGEGSDQGLLDRVGAAAH